MAAGSWTLSIEREISEFFNGYEASVGFGSTYSAMLAAASGVAMGAGTPASWDPYAEIVPSLSAAKCVYRALRHMHTSDVLVLYLLYGPRRAAARAEIGELSPLLPLTRAAEEWRDALVLRESTERESSVGRACGAALAIARVEIEELFWREAGVQMRLARRRRTRPGDVRRLEAGRAWMRQLLQAHRCDGTLRARLGAIAGSDREITIEHALRVKLDLAPRHDRDALREWRAARDVFLAEARAEAAEMQARAREAYRSARRDTRARRAA